MADSTLADVRGTLAEISASILHLPEQRPAQLPPAVAEVIGDLMRACDSLTSALIGYGAERPEAIGLLNEVRAHRRLLFLVFAAMLPDQAEHRTESAGFQEKVTNAKRAAGLIPTFYTDDRFAETLRAQWLGRDSE